MENRLDINVKRTENHNNTLKSLTLSSINVISMQLMRKIGEYDRRLFFENVIYQNHFFADIVNW